MTVCIFLSLASLALSIFSVAYLWKRGKRNFWTMLIFGTLAVIDVAKIYGYLQCADLLFSETQLIAETLLLYLRFLLLYVFDRRIEINNLKKR